MHDGSLNCQALQIPEQVTEQLLLMQECNAGSIPRLRMCFKAGRISSPLNIVVLGSCIEYMDLRHPKELQN